MGIREELLNNLTGDTFTEEASSERCKNNNEALPWEPNNGAIDLNEEANKSISGTIKTTLSKLDLSSNKTRLTIGIIVILILVCTFSVYKIFNTGSANTISLANSENSEQTVREITVHLGGAVSKPGVYKLQAGSRIMDAVEQAGGLTSNANSDEINLAKVLEDGEQIIIPSKTDTSSSANSQSSSAPTTDSNNGKVNINTADLTTLQTLSGVGPSTAQKIIDYRNANGKFKTIEDLKKVSGIGEKTFAKFSDKICV